MNGAYDTPACLNHLSLNIQYTLLTNLPGFYCIYPYAHMEHYYELMCLFRMIAHVSSSGIRFIIALPTIPCNIINASVITLCRATYCRCV